MSRRKTVCDADNIMRMRKMGGDPALYYAFKSAVIKEKNRK